MWTYKTAIQELTIDPDGATTVRTAFIFNSFIETGDVAIAAWLKQNGQHDRTYCMIDIIVWEE